MKNDLLLHLVYPQGVVSVFLRDSVAYVAAKAHGVEVEVALGDLGCLSMGRALILAAETTINDARRSGVPA